MVLKNPRGQSGLFGENFNTKIGTYLPNILGLLGYWNNIFFIYKGKIFPTIKFEKI